MFSLLLGLHCSHFQLCHICVSLAFSFVFNNSNQVTDHWRISKFFAYRTSWAAFTGYFIFHPSGTSTLVTSVQRIYKFLLPLLLIIIILIMILIIMIMNLPLNPLNPLCLVPDNFGPVSCSTLIPLWIWCLGPIFVLPWSELLCCSLSRPFLATGRISWYQPFPLSMVQPIKGWDIDSWQFLLLFLFSVCPQLPEEQPISMCFILDCALDTY